MQPRTLTRERAPTAGGSGGDRGEGVVGLVGVFIPRPGVDGISFTVHPGVGGAVGSAMSGRIQAEKSGPACGMGLKAQEEAQRSSWAIL